MKHKKIWMLVSLCIVLCGIFICLHVFAEKEVDLASSFDGLSVSFYPLDNSEMGDSCIIRYGDVQILIDAGPGKGSNEKSINSIISQMNIALEGDREKKWEYVIVTHGDADHITSLSTNEKFDLDTGVIHEMIKRHNVAFDTLIDFDTIKADGKHLVKVSSLAYDRYSCRRKDSFSNYFTASQLCSGRAHDISLGEDCVLTILYNRFYDEQYYVDLPEGVSDSAKANLLSVCILLKYKEQTFLFTGDLGEYDSSSPSTENGYSRRIFGETYLLQDNEEYFKNGITFFKAGHHGSKTSNSEDFIDAIYPQYVVIPTIAGTSEYNTDTQAEDAKRFPSQTVLSRFLKYTDQILIPSKAILDEETGKTKNSEDYYGTITITSNGQGIRIKTSSECDGNGAPFPITQTTWFKNNRTDTGASLKTFVFELPEAMKAIGHCSLIKCRNTEILIDCGIFSENYKEINTMYFVDKIRQHCADGVLEYVIISNGLTVSMSNVIDTYSKNGANGDGVFSSFEIQNLIDFGKNTNYLNRTANSWLQRYFDQRDALIKNGTAYNSGKIQKNGSVKYYPIKNEQRFSITILNQNPEKDPKNEADFSLCTIVEYYGEKMVFTGCLTNEEDFESAIAEKYKDLLNNATFYLAGNSGYQTSNSSDFLSVISPEYTVIASVAGIKLNGKIYLTKNVTNRLYFATDKINNQRNVYLTSEYINGNKKDVCGDIVFTLDFQNGNVAKKMIKGSSSSNPINF